tara:strand:+ start:2756 stop:4381 length:1626 start_codon:yes stop_codon:yes gene_type:complete
MAYIGNSPVQDETVSSAQIIDGAIVNADINSSAAIALSKTALVAGTGLTLSTNTLNVDAAQTGITSVGTIGTGVWQGTAVASAYLDADTAHLSGTQTFSGAKTFSSAVNVALSDASVSPSSDADDLVVESNGACGITIGSAADSVGSLRFADSGASHAGMLYYSHASNFMKFYTDATERMIIDNAGKVGIGSQNTTLIGYADAAANNLVVGSSTGDEGITIISGASAGDYGALYFGDANRGTNGRIMYEQNNEIMSFYTNNTEKMRIDLNGNVGIGTDSPTAFYPCLQVEGTQPAIILNDSGTVAFFTTIVDGTGAVEQLYDHEGSITWKTATNNGGSSAVARMTLNESGNLDIGGRAYNSSSGGFYMNDGRIQNTITADSSGYEVMMFDNTTANGTVALLQYRTNGVAEGSIIGDSSGLAISNVSDYRKKERITDLKGSLDAINSLKPREYYYREEFAKSTRAFAGFIAHEVQESKLPYLTTGSKDGVVTQEDLDNDLYSEKSVGEPVYQTVAYSDNEMITRLVGAVQELSAKLKKHGIN